MKAERDLSIRADSEVIVDDVKRELIHASGLTNKVQWWVKLNNRAEMYPDIIVIQSYSYFWVLSVQK